MNPWTRTTDALPPEGERVETMIADEDGGMYVYYRPTHWRMA